jgi:hypothetical protein
MDKGKYVKWILGIFTGDLQACGGYVGAKRGEETRRVK